MKISFSKHKITKDFIDSWHILSAIQMSKDFIDPWHILSAIQITKDLIDPWHLLLDTTARLIKINKTFDIFFNNIFIPQNGFFHDSSTV